MLTPTDCYFLGCCIYLMFFSVCLCNLVLIDCLILRCLESFVWDGRPNKSNKHIHLKCTRVPSLDGPRKKTSLLTVVWMWNFLLLIKTGFCFIPDVSLNKARKRRSVFLIRMMAIWPQIMWVRNVTQLLQMSKDCQEELFICYPSVIIMFATDLMRDNYLSSATSKGLQLHQGLFGLNITRIFFIGKEKKAGRKRTIHWRNGGLSFTGVSRKN